MRLFACLSILLVLSSAKANNIAVTNVALAGQNTSAGANNAANFTYIEFDLSWDNSWRTSSSPNNWDAAWVFVKYRTVGTSVWNHVLLANGGHTSSGTGTSYSVHLGLVDESQAYNNSTNPAVGAFIYRSANGTGTFSAQDIRLKWNYFRDNGVGDNDIVDIDVYAIEMVNVPQGSFWLGNNGSSSANAFYASGVSGSGYQMTGEHDQTYFGPANGGATAGSLIITGGVAGSGSLGVNFPKGFAAFYCMKYECSQQLYADFLNSLTSAQQAVRVPSNLALNRNNFTVSSGIYSTSTPFVPVHFVADEDLMAILDWAGLRPMSEFEFEKACRGISTPVTNEYAWGSTNLTAHLASLTNAGTSTEVSATVGANAAVSGGDSRNATNGPIRCGAFGTSSSTRESSGASFYGIMELSGNSLEQTVMATQTFNGKIHGNGSLHSSGKANVSGWLNFSSGTNNAGSSTFLLRGGCWDGYYFAGTSYSMVCSRQLLGTGYYSRSFAGFGIRGVRTQSTQTSVETK